LFIAASSRHRSRLSRVTVCAAGGPVARACSARPVYMMCRVVRNTCESKHKARFTPLKFKINSGLGEGAGHISASRERGCENNRETTHTVHAHLRGKGAAELCCTHL